MILCPIAPCQIELAWPLLEGFFADACQRHPTNRTPASIRAEAENGQLSLWAIVASFEPLTILAGVATHFSEDGKTVAFAALGGRDMHLWLDLLVNEIEQLSQSQGAACAEIEGRPGWQRVMRRFGYAPSPTALRKAL